MNNENLLRDIPTNVGIITVIDTSRKNRPKGLRKPYEYVLKKKIADEKYNTIRTYLKAWEADKGKFQHVAAWKKGISKGFKFTIFILGYNPGFCGDSTGVTKNEWDEISTHTQALLTDMLGPDARAYRDEFVVDDKFMFKFEAYIAYEEML